MIAPAQQVAQQSRATEVPQATSPLAATVAGPWGLDASRWQHPSGADIDWAAAAGSFGGLSFTYLKASQGERADANPYFDADRDSARSAVVAVGAYHYAEPNRPVVQDALGEAAAAVQAAGSRSPGDLPVALDFEANPNALSPQEMATWALTWLEEVERLTGQRPVFYTYPAFFSTQVSPDPALGQYPLWIAHYGLAVDRPWVPRPWTMWTFWQYSTRGAVPGIAADVDLNVFAGTPLELALLTGATQPAGAPGSDTTAMGQALLAGLTAPPVQRRG